MGFNLIPKKKKMDNNKRQSKLYPYFYLKKNTPQANTRFSARVFIKFLLMHGIYDIFIERFCSVNNIVWVTNHHNRSCSPSDYINNAFCWSDTKEGHIFWENIDEQWRDHLDFIIK